MKKNFFEFRSGFSYEDALRMQGLLNQEGYTGLLGFESFETITLGKAVTNHNDILVSPDFLKERNISVLATDRGGKATWHGAGQLVGFPLGNLKELYNDAKAVKRFNDELLMGLAHACAVMGVKSVETRAQMPGLWTSKGKLASVGLMIKDGFIFHGFALNITQNCISGFGLINPCGIENCHITYLENEGVKVSSIRDVAKKVFPYLPVYSHKEPKTAISSYDDDNHSALVTKVSHSMMAIDYYHASIAAQHTANGEVLEH